MRTERRPARFAPMAVLALSLAVALGACQEEKKPAGKTSAGGEVLPASVSDAMLPVDSVRSQPPLAPKPSGSAKALGSKSSAGAGEDAASEEEAASDAEPQAPAEEPAAEQ